MSRAFVTDKEDWAYCPKAGERCMHAAPDKSCTETSCEHFDKEAAPAGKASAAMKVVQKTPKKAKATQAAAAKAAKPATRTTKKSKLQKPKKWGGRSGGFWVLP